MTREYMCPKCGSLTQVCVLFCADFDEHRPVECCDCGWERVIG